VFSPKVPLKVFESRCQVFATFLAGSVLHNLNTDKDDPLPQMAYKVSFRDGRKTLNDRSTSRD
jgi:hypothetical protein